MCVYVRESACVWVNTNEFINAMRSHYCHLGYRVILSRELYIAKFVDVFFELHFIIYTCYSCFNFHISARLITKKVGYI